MQGASPRWVRTMPSMGFAFAAFTILSAQLPGTAKAFSPVAPPVFSTATSSVRCPGRVAAHSPAALARIVRGVSEVQRERGDVRMAAGAAGGESMEEITIEELEATAELWGLSLSFSNLGPFYRAVVRLKNDQPGAGEGDTSGKDEAFAYTTGSILGSLLRQDTMRIASVNTGNAFSGSSRNAGGERDRSAMIKERGWRSPSVNGISILLGAYAMVHARDKGCTKAELLAIKDEDRQHAVLTRHYKRLGMVPVREITEDIACVPGARERESGGSRSCARECPRCHAIL
ncbi:hypothetical protein T484DRAFT_3137015 [Baffinella frigidus]|nr:hypothetical protein T484DRAFT_3137015 [Cryptophyta sp. CCMP2293]